MNSDTIIVRGGGDIATGVIQKLYRVGFKVLVLETEHPTAVRRTVSISEAIYEGEVTVEDVTGVLVKDIGEIYKAWAEGNVPVIIDPAASYIDILEPLAVVDAIIAKKNLGMKKDLAPITIAIGPGFEAGKDVDIVIESNRGHNLGRLIFEGSAQANTGIPEEVCSYRRERVLYSPCAGIFKSEYKIGDIVRRGDLVARVNGEPIYARFDGVIRGLLRNGSPVKNNLKVGDIDPRIDQIKNCYSISDKARAIGGGSARSINDKYEKIKYILLIFFKKQPI